MRASSVAAGVLLTVIAGAAWSQDREIPPGTYEIIAPDGTTMRYLIKDDGTYSVTVEGQTVETGAVRFADNRACFKPADGSEMCYDHSAPAEDGSFSSAPADGGPTVTVRPVAD